MQRNDTEVGGALAWVVTSPCVGVVAAAGVLTRFGAATTSASVAPQACTVGFVQLGGELFLRSSCSWSAPFCVCGCHCAGVIRRRRRPNNLWGPRHPAQGTLQRMRHTDTGCVGQVGAASLCDSACCVAYRQALQAPKDDNDGAAAVAWPGAAGPCQLCAPTLCCEPPSLRGPCLLNSAPLSAENRPQSLRLRRGKREQPGAAGPVASHQQTSHCVPNPVWAVSCLAQFDAPHALCVEQDWRVCGLLDHVGGGGTQAERNCCATMVPCSILTGPRAPLLVAAAAQCETKPQRPAAAGYLMHTNASAHCARRPPTMPPAAC